MGRLDGKIALITGAARGLGAAIARRFHQEGADVVVNDLDEEQATRAARSVEGLAIAADVTDSAAVAAMFDQVRQQHGRLDILVNNAGIGGWERDPEATTERIELTVKQAEEIASGQPVSTHVDFTSTLADDEWRRMIGVHLDGTFFCTREALKSMNAQGAGTIINMGSIMGTAGGAGSSHYCAAKAGILGFTRSVAREVATRGIRVNAIAPGWIDTDMTSIMGAMRPLIVAHTPLLRFGDVDDIAWAAVYLASEEAKFVTGQVLSPNGGWHMSQ